MFHKALRGCLRTVNTVIGNIIEIVHNMQSEKLYIVHYFCAFLQKDIDILID